MPLYGDKENTLSLGLVEFLLKSARDYCREEGIPEENLPELFGGDHLEIFARRLNLKVEVKSCFLARPEWLDVALKTNFKKQDNTLIII